MERNREIDLYRVFFAIIVVFVHSHGLRVPDPTHYPFCGGYLAVEFFFMLTGYFAARKIEHPRDAQTAACSAAVWTIRKFLRLYQYVIPAVILGLLFVALVITFSNTKKSGKTCGSFLAELSLALYVSHWTVRAVIPVIMPGIAYEKMLVPYLLGSLIYAGSYVAAINAVRRLSLTEKLKRCFLLQKYQ